ncbi:putative ATPase [Hymenobacter sp. UYAg731]
MAEPTQDPTPATPVPAAPDVRLLRSITLRNILSFGPDTPPLELRALNVLIGPNGSGKSNLLDAVELLKKAPDAENLRAELKADHWLWKGKPEAYDIIISVDTRLKYRADVTHSMEIDTVFTLDPYSWIVTELILSKRYLNNDSEFKVEFESGTGTGTAKVNSQESLIEVPRAELNYAASSLFQFRNPHSYSILTHLGEEYRRIRLYREWTFGRNSTPRLPRRTDERNDFLAEDGSNLGLVLNKLRTYPEVKDQFISALNELYEGIKDFDVLVEGGSAQIFLREGNTSIPATRLSDGTLRYLCLLAILLHPTPPPLICLEEPELGLHPDAVVAVGKLILQASERTQLIITTHSDILVDVLGQVPENIVVCEKHDGQTHMTRLNEADLRGWLERYSLSQLWTKGKLGGTRW